MIKRIEMFALKPVGGEETLDEYMNRVQTAVNLRLSQYVGEDKVLNMEMNVAGRLRDRVIVRFDIG